MPDYNPIRKPSVEVEQVYVTPTVPGTTPILPACIIGPNIHYVYRADVGNYTGVSAVYDYDNLPTGATVDTADVQMYFYSTGIGTVELADADLTIGASSVTVGARAYIRWNRTSRYVMSGGSFTGVPTIVTGANVGTDGVTALGALTFTSAGSNFLTSGILPGQILRIHGGSTGVGTYKIESVDSANQLTVKDTNTFTSFSAGAALEFVIGSDTISFTDDDYDTTGLDFANLGLTNGGGTANKYDHQVYIASGTNAGTWSIDSLTDSDTASLNMCFFRGSGATAAGGILTDVSENFTSEGVATGDYLVIENGAATASYTITAVGTSTITAAGLPGGAAIHYRIVRVPSTSTDSTWVGYEVLYGETGSILQTYGAVRQDNVGALISVETTAGIQSSLGEIVPGNPLAMGAYLALLNSSDNPVYATAVSGDTVAGYVSALEFLESYNVYAIVPLTQSTSINAIIKAHVDAQSEPEKKHERIAIINRDLYVSENVSTGDGGTLTTTVFVDGGATFQADGNITGNEIILTYDGSSETALVTGVVSETRLQVTGITGTFATDYTAGSGGTWYTKTKDLDRMGQAIYVGDYAYAYADKRVVLWWPDDVTLTYTTPTGADNTGNVDTSVTVAGYYGACCTAGLMSGITASDPLTNLTITGIDTVPHSLGYFTPAQLDQMAGGGVCIYAQDSSTSLPYCRDQLTTDISILERREMSIVRAVDYTAKYIRTGVSHFIGKFNVSEALLKRIADTTQMLLSRLIDDKILARAKLKRVYQSTTSPDQVLMELDLTPLYPLRRLTITLYI